MRNGARIKENWTKVDVRKETRDKLQAEKYAGHYSTVDEMLTIWIEMMSTTPVNKNLKGKKEHTR